MQLTDSHPPIVSVFLKNAMWLLLDRGAFKIATLIAGLLFVRFIGPSGYGSYAMALAVGTIAATVSDFGLTRYAARAVAARRDATPKILATALVLAGTFAFVQVVCLIAARQGGNGKIAIICAGLLLGNFEMTSAACAAILNGQLRSAEVAPGSAVGAVGTVLVIGAAIWLQLPVVGILLGLAVKNAVVTGIRFYQLCSDWPRSRDFNLVSVRATMFASWPFFSYVMAENAYTQLPIVCLGLVASPAQVGWFAAALTVTGVIPQWTYAIFDALLPIATRLYETGRHLELVRLCETVSSGLIGATLPVSLLLCGMADILPSILGSQFRGSVPCLRIASLMIVPLLLWAFMGTVVLTAADRLRERRNRLAVSVGFCAAITLVAGSVLGARGAALALLFSNGLTAYIYYRACWTSGLRFQVFSFAAIATVWKRIRTNPRTVFAQ